MTSWPVAVVLAASRAPGSSIQWATLAWIAGAVVVAAIVITGIVVASRRPKSMEDGIAQFARSLQAVAPRAPAGARRATDGRARPAQPTVSAADLAEQRPARTGEA